MATPLSDVYNSFLNSVTDYKFIELNSQDDDNDGVTNLEDVLYGHLKKAIVRFTNCNKDLTIDEINQQFNADLDLDEKEILASIMSWSYVSGKILNVKNMEQNLSEREYRTYSQANHLKEMLSLKSNLQSEISQLMISYSLKNGLDDLA